MSHKCPCARDKFSSGFEHIGHDGLMFDKNSFRIALCNNSCGTIRCLDCGKESYMSGVTTTFGHSPRCGTTCPDCDGFYSGSQNDFTHSRMCSFVGGPTKKVSFNDYVRSIDAISPDAILSNGASFRNDIMWHQNEIKPSDFGNDFA